MVCLGCPLSHLQPHRLPPDFVPQLNSVAHSEVVVVVVVDDPVLTFIITSNCLRKQSLFFLLKKKSLYV